MSQRILVAIGNTHGQHRRVLQRAAALAGESGRIELLHALGDAGRLALGGSGRALLGLQRSLKSSALRRLRHLAASPALRGIRVSCRITEDYPVHEAIVRRARHIGADLLIVDSHGHTRAGRWLFGSVDWELVRTCPCPLLIVKPRAGRQRGPVLAAIDPNHAAAKPVALDRQILRAAHDISVRLKRPLRAVHAWQPLTYLYASAPTETAPVWIPPETDAQYEQTLRRQGDAELRRADLASAQIEYLIGAPEEVLPELARKSHAELIVMGAISRTGLERLMLGSTAQRVMDRVPCDILVIKPRGFRSPISRAGRLAPPIIVPQP